MTEPYISRARSQPCLICLQKAEEVGGKKYYLCFTEKFSHLLRVNPVSQKMGFACHPTYFLSPCPPLLHFPSSLQDLPAHSCFPWPHTFPSFCLLSRSALGPRFRLLFPSLLPHLTQPLPPRWVLAERLNELRTRLQKSTLSFKPEIHFIWSVNYLNFPLSMKKPCHLVPFPTQREIT